MNRDVRRNIHYIDRVAPKTGASKATCHVIPNFIQIATFIQVIRVKRR